MAEGAPHDSWSPDLKHVEGRSTLATRTRLGRARDRRAMREWLLVCLELEAGERRIAMMETHDGDRVVGKAFLTDRRLVCTNRAPDGVYMPNTILTLSAVSRTIRYPADRVIVVRAGHYRADVTVTARARRVSGAQFERFATLVNDGIAAAAAPS